MERYRNASTWEVLGHAPGEAFDYELPEDSDEDTPRARALKQDERTRFQMLVDSGLLEHLSKNKKKEKHG